MSETKEKNFLLRANETIRRSRILDKKKKSWYICITIFVLSSGGVPIFFLRYGLIAATAKKIWVHPQVIVPLNMKFDILTIFPKIIEQYSSESILKRGQAAGAIKIMAHDFRKFTTDKHHKVDDSPYGGGPGMVLKVEPIFNCLKSLGVLSVIPAKAGIQKRRRPDSRSPMPLEDKLRGNDKKTKIIILDPAGKKFDQKMARRFAKLERLVLICGRYEGFDERVYKFVDEKISVGDYVLSGGELPALVVVEAVARLVSGVVGNAESLKEETFEGFVEYPQYTRPEDFLDMKAPKVLLSGNHKKIEEWRKKHSCG